MQQGSEPLGWLAQVHLLWFWGARAVGFTPTLLLIWLVCLLLELTWDVVLVLGAAGPVGAIAANLIGAAAAELALGAADLVGAFAANQKESATAVWLWVLLIWLEQLLLVWLVQ